MGAFWKQDAWWIEWYEGRRRLRKKTNARTKTEAKKLFNQVKAKMLPRELGLFDQKLTCAELVTRYLEALKATRRDSTYRRATNSLRNFFDWCPVRQALKVTPEMVDRYIGFRRTAGAKSRTINLEITNLKSVYNWGVRNKLVPYNPVAQASKLKGDASGRLRFLSADEIAKLLHAARQTAYHDVIYTLLKTGMRIGELVHLRWEDVDFVTSLMRVGGYKDANVDHDTKNHRERHLAIDADLAAVLARQPRVPGIPFVFATRDGAPRANNAHREITRHARAAGMNDVTPHTLRHTFASHLVMAGADLPSVQKLLGHSDISLTMRYAHLAQGHLRKAMSKMVVPDHRDGPNVVPGPGFKRKAGNG